MVLNHKTILWLAVIGSVLFQLLELLYVSVKGGGTTGADPLWYITIFAVLLLAGLMTRFVWYGFESERAVASLLVVTAGFGCALPLFLHFTGSLVYYERWIKGGMRSLPDNPNLYLMGFGAFLMLAVGLTAFLEGAWQRNKTET